MAAWTHPLPRLLSYARHHRSRVIAAAACSVANKIFDLAPPALIGAAVDVVVAREDSLIASFGFPNAEDQLIVLTVPRVLVVSAASSPS